MSETVYEFINFIAKNKETIEDRSRLDIYAAYDHDRRASDYPYLIDEDEGLYTGNVDRAFTLLEIFGRTMNWNIISLGKIRMEYEKLMIEMDPWASSDYYEMNAPYDTD